MYTMEQEQAISGIQVADKEWAAFEKRSDTRLFAGRTFPPDYLEREQPYYDRFKQAVDYGKSLGLTAEDWRE